MTNNDKKEYLRASDGDVEAFGVLEEAEVELEVDVDLLGARAHRRENDHLALLALELFH